MYILGVTGNIGSGKTTVTNMLQEMGAYVSHSDDLAKELLRSDPTLKEKILAHFGTGIYDQQGQLVPSVLAERAFKDSQSQQILNGLIHPEVRRATQARIAAAEADGVALFVVDAPLLLEAGVDEITHSVLVVAASSSLRQKRVFQRSAIDEKDFQRRDALQMSIEEKLLRADHVIWNDEDLQQLKQKVLALFQELSL